MGLIVVVKAVLTLLQNNLIVDLSDRIDTSLGSQPDSDMNLCEAVLGSFEKLNHSQSRSRKTLYQPYGP